MASHPVDVMMAVAMAREVRPGDWVSHGAAVPLAGAALYLAIETHAPDVEFWIQGCVSPTNRNLADALIEPERILPTARAHLSQTEIINFELRGNGLFQFLRPLQIDPFGNINASLVERPGGAPLRFHGVAVGDALNIVRRVCLYVTEHTPRVFTEQLRYRTATGHHDGSDWRASHGIKPAGPTSVVTPMAVLEFGPDRRLRIRSVHRGYTVRDVEAATGFELGVPERVEQTPEPTAVELAALERVDPDGIRLLEFRETRLDVLRRLAGMQATIKESA
jgi:glutaconate CoA-transferase, subunit B